ncbi:WD40 repeat domain-containing protein, partial [Streptomyces sp. 4N509B]|uniref:WD40 repeat domain-containing protein n=1 Tax=Streptomyces sp. 4N509B TaxID=3457413 RepID=UPI003FCF79CC
TYTGHTNVVRAVAIAELNGRPHALTTSSDHTVRVWDLTTGTTTHTYTGHTNWVRAVAIAELNGRPHALTTSSDHTVRVWDLTTGTTVSGLHLPDAANAVAACPDGTVVLGVGHEVLTLSLSLHAGSSA